eukprot:5842027-Amphidinium_carterae.1
MLLASPFRLIDSHSLTSACTLHRLLAVAGLLGPRDASPQHSCIRGSVSTESYGAASVKPDEIWKGWQL